MTYLELNSLQIKPKNTYYCLLNSSYFFEFIFKIQMALSHLSNLFLQVHGNSRIRWRKKETAHCSWWYQALLRPLPNGSFKRRGCAQCNNMTKCEYVCHPHTGKRLQINDVITCSTTHVIYIIKCPCGMCYVGKTSRSLTQRISEDKSSIRRNDRDYPVAVHLNDLKHDISTFRFCGIEKVKISDRRGDINNTLE